MKWAMSLALWAVFGLIDGCGRCCDNGAEGDADAEICCPALPAIDVAAVAHRINKRTQKKDKTVIFSDS